MVRIDLQYYKTVAEKIDNSEILKKELLDLIKDIESDPIYRSVVGIMKNEPYKDDESGKSMNV